MRDITLRDWLFEEPVGGTECPIYKGCEVTSATPLASPPGDAEYVLIELTTQFADVDPVREIVHIDTVMLISTK